MRPSLHRPRLWPVFLALACLPSVPCAGGENPGTPWPASDALGRALPSASAVPSPRADRTVGIFYFLWLDRKGDKLPPDLSKILPQDPDILQKPKSPLWGPMRSFHYWGEPLYGYYHPDDPWVLRRHARLLVDAGIDTVIFDATNRRTYREVYLKLCEVWTQIRQEGGRTPQLCFMVNTKAGETAQEIFHDLYQPGLYPELWFRWQGKPLLICDPAAASPEVREFFTLRRAHWPFTKVNTDRAWHWEATYPQPFGYDGDSAKIEQVNVSVAQNLHKDHGKPVSMSTLLGRGRSYHAGAQNITPGSVNHGHNFREQWQRAYELDPPFVMITGWNEWIAGRYERPGQPVSFVDQFDQEFSRDIEPVKGLHGDNYYYQMVAHVRRYKGRPALPTASAAQSIELAAGFAPWRDIAPVFTDHLFDNDHRDHGQGARHYVNPSGRNDLAVMKVARDAAHVFFYAQTRQPLTPRTDPNWMWLLIDTDQNPETGWEGYDFILNRTLDGQTTWLEKNTGGWNWERVAEVPLVTEGNEVMLAIPRASLGLPAGDTLEFDFKWWDHAQQPGDIMDVYLSGDTAPDARFNYRYSSAAAARPQQAGTEQAR
jgi:hypothetical protein